MANFTVGCHVQYTGGGRFQGDHTFPNGEILCVGDQGIVHAIPGAKAELGCTFGSLKVSLNHADVQSVSRFTRVSITEQGAASSVSPQSARQVNVANGYQSTSAADANRAVSDARTATTSTKPFADVAAVVTSSTEGMPAFDLTVASIRSNPRNMCHDGSSDDGREARYAVDGVLAPQSLEGMKFETCDNIDTVCLNIAHGMRRGVKVEATYFLNGRAGATLCVSSGDILRFNGDAIVAAATERVVGLVGVNKKITDAGGARLIAAQEALPILPGGKNVRCPVGEARMTTGGELPSSHCIFAVGPQYSGKNMAPHDASLLDAYKSAMACAQSVPAKTIAFSLICGGMFRGSQTLRRVIEIGIEGIRTGAYSGLEEVHVIAFKPDELLELKRVCRSMLRTHG